MPRIFGRHRKHVDEATRRRRVLFLCTGNSCRSQIAEGLINRLDLNGGRFEGASAGSDPAGCVHPMAIEVAHELHADISRNRCKSWENLKGETFDFVITLCGHASSAVPKAWPGDPVMAHWEFEDPIKCKGGDEEKRTVFRNLARGLLRCIEQLISLPVEMLDRATLLKKLDEIGRG
jgi:arsenate reductase